MENQSGHQTQRSPSVAACPKAESGSGGPVDLPVVEHVSVGLMTVDPEMRIIGINEPCRATLLRLCGKRINIGDCLSSVPIQFEAPTHAYSTLEIFCRQSLAGEAFYTAGRCIGPQESRSLLLRVTPVLDGFLRTILVHITVQDFPGDMSHSDGTSATTKRRDAAEPSRIPTEDAQQTFDSAPIGIAQVAPTDISFMSTAH